MAFVSSSVRPGDALQAFALADDYSFAVLQSKTHYLWFHAKCSNMKSDPRYTSESVFHTFPWPGFSFSLHFPTHVNVHAFSSLVRTSINDIMMALSWVLVFVFCGKYYVGAEDVVLNFSL